jgi:hypothetical protein
MRECGGGGGGWTGSIWLWKGDRWRALVNAVMNVRVPENMENLFLDWLRARQRLRNTVLHAGNYWVPGKLIACQSKCNLHNNFYENT